MIQIVPCRQCNEELLLPDDVSLRATLSCPQCGERVVLGEFLESSFAYWNVVEDPLSAETSTASAYPATDTEGSHRRSAPMQQSDPSSLASKENNNEGGQELELEEASGPSKSKSRPRFDVQPITHEQFERTKRKQRSPVWGILQVALGGIAAIPIALLILWHLLGKDIAGAGPAVAVYAPWIVPEQFRPIEGESEAKASPRLRGESGFRNFDDVMPWTEAGDRTAAEDSIASGPDQEVTSGELEMNPSGNPSGLRRNSDAMDGKRGFPPGEFANDDEPGSRGVPSLESAENSTLGPSVGPDTRNVLLLVERCRQDLNAWKLMADQEQIADAATKRQLAQKLYRDLSELGAVINALPERTPVVRAIRNSLQPLGRSVKNVSGVQQVIEQGSSFWLESYPNRSSLPLAIVIEIETADEEDEGWVVQPTADSLPSKIEKVFVPSALAPSLIPGQRLFLLGQFQSQTTNSDSKLTSNKIQDDAELSKSDSRLKEDRATSQPWFKASYLYGL